MKAALTHGVLVSVQTFYQPEYSAPASQHFVFTYKIQIENHSDMTVQLLRRHWYIADAAGSVREVEGEGVVGQQPILESGQLHEYLSGCNLRSGMGKMMGTYTFQRMVDGSTFEVEIPEFPLFAFYKLN
jgi:ApaG protein